MKIKICVATGERKVEHMFGQEQLVHLVSRLDDRKKTIKLLKSVQGGRYWDDLTWSWIYELNIAPSNDKDYSEREIEKFLLTTTNKKWEKFVRVFCPKEDTTIEIKTIEVGLGDVKNY